MAKASANKNQNNATTKVVVTQELLDKNPALVEQGVKVVDEIDAPAKHAPAKPSTENVELMKPYLKAYPKEKKFYITSDKQVFLEASKRDAEAHQQQLDKNVKVAEFNA